MKYITMLVGLAMVATVQAQSAELTIATLQSQHQHYRAEAFIGDSVTIHRGERFYFYPEYGIGITKAMVKFSIVRDDVQLLERELLFRFRPTLYILDTLPYCDAALYARKQGHDYKSLLHNAANGSTEAIVALFQLARYADGGAVETIYDDCFKVINFWEDRQLAELVRSDASFARSWYSVLLQGSFASLYSEPHVESYMRSFYPLTYAIISVKK